MSKYDFISLLYMAGCRSEAGKFSTVEAECAGHTQERHHSRSSKDFLRQPLPPVEVLKIRFYFDSEFLRREMDGFTLSHLFVSFCSLMSLLSLCPWWSLCVFLFTVDL